MASDKVLDVGVVSINTDGDINADGSVTCDGIFTGDSSTIGELTCGNITSDGAGSTSISADESLTLSSGVNGLVLNSNGNLITVNLPTSDPALSGALWSDSGTVKVSAG
jgi:hypothetical protein